MARKIALVTGAAGAIGQAICASLAANGAEIVGSTPEQFAAYIAGEIAKWQKVVKAAGIKPE